MSYTNIQGKPTNKTGDLCRRICEANPKTKISTSVKLVTAFGINHIAFKEDTPVVEEHLKTLKSYTAKEKIEGVF